LGKSNFDTLTVTKKQEEENAVVVFFKFKRRKKEGARCEMRLPRSDKSELTMTFKDRTGQMNSILTFQE
jgi:hypothetical protein